MLVSCVCGRERVLVKLSRCGIAIFWISHLGGPAFLDSRGRPEMSRCGISIFSDFAPALHLSGLFHQRYFSVDPVGTNMYSNKIMNTAV